jgi:hypothetical protein
MTRLFALVLLSLSIVLTACGNNPSNGPSKSDIDQAVRNNLEQPPSYTFIRIEKKRIGNCTKTLCPMRVIALFYEHVPTHTGNVLVYFNFKFIKLDKDFGAKWVVNPTAPEVASDDTKATMQNFEREMYQD